MEESQRAAFISKKQAETGVRPLPAPESNQAAVKAGKRRIVSYLQWWWPELLASLCSIASFAAIIGVARHFRGHPLGRSGLPSGLTLNGLIALLATISRAALLIPVASALSQEAFLWLSVGRGRSSQTGQLRDLDISHGASQGAVGSLKMLGHFRRSWLAHFAAVVTIVSLLFGTFTQQLVTIAAFSVTDGQLKPGNIPWSRSFQQRSGDPHYQVVSPPLSVKAAVYSGMLNPKTESISAPCETGNCTWPVTSTLSICGGCMKTTYNVTCDPPTFSPAICVYHMPSGANTSLAETGNTNPSTISTDFQVIPSLGFHYNTSDPTQFFVANFETVGAPANQKLTSLKQDAVVASECALWVCVQSIESRQTNSNQISTIKEESSRIIRDSRWGNIGQDTVSYNLTFEPLPPSMNPLAGMDFTIDSLAAYGLQSYLSGIFNGSINRIRGTTDPTSDAIQALWNASSDLDSWIKNVASSVNNVMRTAEPAYSEQLNGVAYQLGYDIRWAWLSLPAFLVLASLIVLATIMIQTWRTPAVQAWKGNPLTLLFMRVERGLYGNASQQIDRYQGLENGVGKARAVLSRNEDGEWVFKEKTG